MDWDVSSFGNEQAQEWLKELVGSASNELVDQALTAIDASDLFIDSQDAERAIAACEVIAAAGENPSNMLPKAVVEWIKFNNYKVDYYLVKRASSAVDMIIKNSELADLWAGTDAASEWLFVVEDLQKRLVQLLEKLIDDTAELETYTQPAPDSTVESAFNEAIEEVSKGNHRGAVAKFNYVLELDKEFVVGYIGRGTSFLALGKFEAALKDLNSAIDRDPEIPDAYNLRAQAYFQLNHFGRAIADLTILLNMSPDRSDAFLMRGLANTSMNRFDRAIKDFTRAIELDEGAVNAYLHRARAYEKEGKFDLAGKDRKQYERLMATAK